MHSKCYKSGWRRQNGKHNDKGYNWKQLEDQPLNQKIDKERFKYFKYSFMLSFLYKLYFSVTK